MAFLKIQQCIFTLSVELLILISLPKLLEAADGGHGNTSDQVQGPSFLVWFSYLNPMDSSFEGNGSILIRVEPFTVYKIGGKPMTMCTYEYVGPKHIIVSQGSECAVNVASFKKGTEAHLFETPFHCIGETDNATSSYFTSRCQTAQHNSSKKTVARLLIESKMSFVQCEGFYRRGYGYPQKCVQSLMRLPPRKIKYFFSNEKDTLVVHSTRFSTNVTDSNTTDTNDTAGILPEQNFAEGENVKTEVVNNTGLEGNDNFKQIKDAGKNIRQEEKVKLKGQNERDCDDSSPLSIPEQIILIPLLVFVCIAILLMLKFVLFSYITTKKLSNEITV